MGQLQPADLP